MCSFGGENLKQLFTTGIAISCTGLTMLFIYFVGNELLKKLSGVVEFWYLNPLLAIIAGLVLIIGLSMTVFALDKISRQYHCDN
ncbi:hypothetical protein HNQ34_003407 [Anoxybacillus tepidamans]|uniref:Uncharacterized protein n=1 Tax=Anoxybacteroides tepidamans TaxID=265948 RepID=A0A7W8IT95_9BACL|nr:hypothetical protein [Anoxybacillus tepidamans]